MNFLFSSLLAGVIMAEGFETTPCGSKRSPNLPDPQPGTCVDVGKCCKWTWPPPLTAKVSCDSSVPGGCYGCEAPSCCCQAGLMCLNTTGGTSVASCCSYFMPSGLMCDKYKSDGTPDCGGGEKLCKTISNADCDKCGARCIEFKEETSESVA